MDVQGITILNPVQPQIGGSKTDFNEGKGSIFIVSRGESIINYVIDAI